MSTAIRTEKKRKTALTPHVPDFCPACDAVDHPFLHKQKKAIQEFRGETFTVDATSMRCQHCGFEVAMPGSLDALRLATMDAYRKKHGLLTSVQIIELREMIGMSQREFADYVGVGVASLQRWEKGLVVQDKASDLLIRVMTFHTRYASVLNQELNDQSERSYQLIRISTHSVNEIHVVGSVENWESGLYRTQGSIRQKVKFPERGNTRVQVRQTTCANHPTSELRWDCPELTHMLAQDG